MDRFYEKENKIISCFEPYRASHWRVYMSTGNPFTLPNRILSCSLTNNDMNIDCPTEKDIDTFMENDQQYIERQYQEQLYKQQQYIKEQQEQHEQEQQEQEQYQYIQEQQYQQYMQYYYVRQQYILQQHYQQQMVYTPFYALMY